MGFLKGFATTILSIIFLITLAVFSVAFMLQGTVLSYNFVSDQVDKVPLSSIARDLGDQILPSDITQEMPFFEDVVLYIIEDQEPWIKTQLKTTIDTGYDYFLGETDYLSITIPLTELKQILGDSAWDSAKAYLAEELAGKSDAEISSYLQDIIHQLPEDILPPTLASLTPVERNQIIEQYLRDAAGVPPKAGYPALDPVNKNATEQYINQFLNDAISNIPDDKTFDESSIPGDTMHALRDVKRGIGYFQTYYYWLIVLLFVVVGLIFLVNMSVKLPARTLGISLIFIGVIDIVGIILVRTLPMMQYASDILKVDIPASLSTYIQGLAYDVTGVALPLAIGILVGGVILLVVSIVIPAKEKDDVLL
jgi:hypothetical protein